MHHMHVYITTQPLTNNLLLISLLQYIRVINVYTFFVYKQWVDMLKYFEQWIEGKGLVLLNRSVTNRTHNSYRERVCFSPCEENAQQIFRKLLTTFIHILELFKDFPDPMMLLLNSHHIIIMLLLNPRHSTLTFFFIFSSSLNFPQLVVIISYKFMNHNL